MLREKKVYKQKIVNFSFVNSLIRTEVWKTRGKLTLVALQCLEAF